jgi:hypothetical protein
LRDSTRYDKQNSMGKFIEWWMPYMHEQGLRVALRPFMDAYSLWRSPEGRTVGILGMTLPHLKRRHVAAVDAAGVIDPADGFPDHLHLADYIASRLPQGVVFDNDFLAVDQG